MRTVYVDRKHARLEAAAGALTIRVEGARPAHVPLASLERLVVRGEASLSTGLLGALWRRGAGLLILAGRRHEPTATLLGAPHGDARLRLAQYELARDARRRQALARRLLAGKLEGQLRLLRRLLERRPDARRPLLAASERLTRHRAELAGPSGDRLDRLLGIEGSAAAAFFEGFAACFPPALGFVARNRRPPRDPVNACLSLGYTLLVFEAARQCQIAGLDPLLGFLHAPSPGRASLACDLAEPLRCHADELVHGLFAREELRAAHFRTDAAGCLLGKTGRERFYAAWAAEAPALGRLLRRMAGELARELRTVPLPAFLEGAAA